MTPAASCPGVTTGSGPGRLPSSRWTSDRQTPHACTRTTTSCGAATGSSTSTTSRRRAAWSNRAARTGSDRDQLRARARRRELLVVGLDVEALQPPGELEGVVGPDGRVAPGLVEVPAHAAAGVPYRGRQLALDLFVVGRLHLRPHLERDDVVLAHDL